MADDSTKKLSLAELEAELAAMRQQVALFNESGAFARVGHFEWNATRRSLQSSSQSFAAIFGFAGDSTVGCPIRLGKNPAVHSSR